MARLFQAVERDHGAVSRDAVQRLTGLSHLKAGTLLRALRDEASIPRRRLETAERRAAIAVMRAHTPIRRLISRHTRELLRRYAAAGMLSTPIADRRVEDRFVDMSEAERDLYEAVDEHISKTYKQASGAERSAVGFVMTVYRRRLASSFAALRATLERRRDAALPGAVAASALEEDAPDDETLDEVPDADDVAALAARALAFEERGEIEGLLERIAALPPDSKLARLTEALDELARDGYRQVMVFTQYTDTMDFLRRVLRGRDGSRVLCFSGRGGEIPTAGGPDAWRVIDREQVKRRFREGEADLLLCTDAASEGLNFQFCGALVNYDMPWNPMRVEQRIGRIDSGRPAPRGHPRREPALRGNRRDRRLPRPAPPHRALRAGRGTPAADSRRDAQGHRRRRSRRPQGHRRPATSPTGSSSGPLPRSRAGFDIDATRSTRNSRCRKRPPSPVTLDDLDRVITDPSLMPPGTEVRARCGRREYSLLAPGMRQPIRVTTDPAYYEENSESVELWSPGNPFFEAPEHLPAAEVPEGATLKDLLER